MSRQTGFDLSTLWSLMILWKRALIIEILFIWYSVYLLVYAVGRRIVIHKKHRTIADSRKGTQSPV